MIYISDEELSLGSNFVMLCGAPGSGKTTYANKVVKDDNSWVRVAPDDIRRLVTGSSMNMSKDKEVFGIVFDTIREELEAGSNVIYDATNCDFHYRKNMIRFVSDIDGVNIIMCLVSTSTIRDCFNNNDNRTDNQKVDDSVIERMYFNLRGHMPSLSEGFDIIGWF